MKYRTAGLAALVLLLGFSGVVSAHRVNVFAYVDGDAVQVEGYFTRSEKVGSGKVTVTDLVTGEELLEGTTDEQGLFRFRPDAAFLKSGHGMNILLNAGEGHQSAWRISPEELASLAPPDLASPTPDASPAGTEQHGPAAANGLASSSVTDAAELEALIGRVLDAKLASIKQTLARQEDSGPALRDIVGGLGWIIGLLGAAMYMKYGR